MVRRVPREKRKYLLKDSERSGFKYFKRELVRDDGWWVHPEEKDEPAPHPRYIGGEGDINSSDARSLSDRTSVPESKSGIWEELT